MPIAFDPSNEGNVNLNRAQRWIWNFNTFLSNQSPVPWQQSPVCLTFSHSDVQKLLANRSDPTTGATIESAGIRFYLGLYNPETQHSSPGLDACFLQLFGVRSEQLIMFEGNQEVVYNDAYELVGEPGIYGFDTVLSSMQRDPSPFNPIGFAGASGPWGQKLWPAGQNPGFTVGADNSVAASDLRVFAQQYYDACQSNGAIQPFSGGKTVVWDPNGTPQQLDFDIDPINWPRAFFFKKEDILEGFANPASGQLDINIRVYFGITDAIDYEQTGHRPGQLKLLMIGANKDVAAVDPNRDQVYEDGLGTNQILDFSLPCPNMCGNGGYRVFEPVIQF